MSIRGNNGRPNPREELLRKKQLQEAAKGKPMVERLRIARGLFQDVTLAKKLVTTKSLILHVSKEAQLSLEETKAIHAAIKGVEMRRSHMTVLKNNLRQMQQVHLPLAQAAYIDNPCSQNAHAMNAISAEIRCLIMDIEKLGSPEATALEVIQSVLQPMVSQLMQGIISEMRKSKLECSALARGSEAAQAVDASFQRMGKAIGAGIKEVYSTNVERLGVTLKCDLQELRKLGSESKVDSLEKLSAGRSKAAEQDEDD